MFNKDGFNKIGEDIYVYHNFVTEDECNFILHIAKSFSENEWFGRFNTSQEGHKTSIIGIDCILQVKKRLLNRLEKGIYLSDNSSVVRMQKGATWGLHSDNHDFLEVRKKNEQYKDGDEFTLEQNNLWGLVMYFNDLKEGICIIQIKTKAINQKKAIL
jgi:hypothetical protein